MLSSSMKDLLKTRGKKLPKTKQLTCVFNKKQGLFFTPLLRWYLARGLKMTNISLVVEYEKATPLKNYVERLTEDRIRATRDNNTFLAQISKLLVNSGYGRFNMNVTKFKEKEDSQVFQK